jgi:hypothetical protein
VGGASWAVDDAALKIRTAAAAAIASRFMYPSSAGTLSSLGLELATGGALTFCFAMTGR